MELGFVESLRRRWDVLGITEGSGSRKETPGKNASEKDQLLDVDMSDDGAAEDVQDTDAEMVRLDQDGDEGEKARKQIFDGVIVKAVMDSAVQGMLFLSMLPTIHSHRLGHSSTCNVRSFVRNHQRCIHARCPFQNCECYIICSIRPSCLEC